eukprot:m.16705 g.16705  ORF g.16705 m.16705 type:complete len:557 (+) comp11164_c0_seq1:141-1811(+)
MYACTNEIGTRDLHVLNCDWDCDCRTCIQAEHVRSYVVKNRRNPEKEGFGFWFCTYSIRTACRLTLSSTMSRFTFQTSVVLFLCSVVVDVFGYPICEPCSLYATMIGETDDMFCQDKAFKCWSSNNCNAEGHICLNSLKTQPPSRSFPTSLPTVSPSLTLIPTVAPTQSPSASPTSSPSFPTTTMTVLPTSSSTPTLPALPTSLPTVPLSLTMSTVIPTLVLSISSPLLSTTTPMEPSESGLPMCEPCSTYAFMIDGTDDKFCQDSDLKCWSSNDCNGDGEICRNRLKVQTTLPSEAPSSILSTSTLSTTNPTVEVTSTSALTTSEPSIFFGDASTSTMSSDVFNVLIVLVPVFVILVLAIGVFLYKQKRSAKATSTKSTIHTNFTYESASPALKTSMDATAIIANPTYVSLDSIEDRYEVPQAHIRTLQNSVYASPAHDVPVLPYKPEQVYYEAVVTSNPTSASHIGADYARDVAHVQSYDSLPITLISNHDDNEVDDPSVYEIPTTSEPHYETPVSGASNYYSTAINIDHTTLGVGYVLSDIKGVSDNDNNDEV